MGTSQSNSSCDTLVPPTPDHGKGFSPLPKSYIDSFEVKIADGGHTYVKISPYIDEEESTSESTCVGVDISCREFGEGRISCISAHIIARDAQVVNVRPRKEVESKGEQTDIVVRNTKRSRSGLRSLSVNSPVGAGFSFDGGRDTSFAKGEKRRGTIFSAQTLLGDSRGQNTACFMLKETKNAQGGAGLCGDYENARFYIKKKPHEELKFDYDYRIEYVKDEKKRTKKSRSGNWFQRHFMSLFCL